MVKKKTSRLKNAFPHIILVFVLISTVLIVVEISGQLANEGVISTEQPPIISEPTNVPLGPTLTLPPIEDA